MSGAPREVTISIDGREIRTTHGRRVLAAALGAGIFVPHLCGVETGPLPHGACRLCWVEVEGEGRPVTACTLEASDGLRVRTRSARVDRLVESAFDMLISVHPLPCKGCPGHGQCALQEIASSRGMKLAHGRLPAIMPDLPIDESHPRIGMDPNRCVLCGECVRVCAEEGAHALVLAGRGLATRVSTFLGQPLGSSGCTGCGRCATVCPVKALFLRNAWYDPGSAGGTR